MVGNTQAAQVQGMRLCSFSVKTGLFRLLERTGGLGAVWQQGRQALLKSAIVEGCVVFLTFHRSCGYQEAVGTLFPDTVLITPFLLFHC